MLITALAEAWFPALSMAVPETVTGPLGVVATLTAAGQVATPDKESEQAKVTVTGPVLMPLTGVGVTVAVMVGGVLSKLTETLALAVFPATSVAVPVTV